jgi:hypothetical protein
MVNTFIGLRLDALGVRPLNVGDLFFSHTVRFSDQLVARSEEVTILEAEFVHQPVNRLLMSFDAPVGKDVPNIQATTAKVA